MVEPNPNDSRDQLPDQLRHKGVSPSDAEAILAHLHGEALADEAEQAAHGIRHLTVAHGDPESAEDDKRLRQLWQWAWDQEDTQIVQRGTNDISTWLIAGPDADRLVGELETLAHQLNPGWWKIRKAAR